MRDELAPQHLHGRHLQPERREAPRKPRQPASDAVRRRAVARHLRREFIGTRQRIEEKFHVVGRAFLLQEGQHHREGAADGGGCEAGKTRDA